jgi:hypothetical protein
MTRFDEEQLARLIHALPPAPEGWVRAAQELPVARAELDEIVARAEADAEFRRRLVTDLEAALEVAQSSRHLGGHAGGESPHDAP